MVWLSLSFIKVFTIMTLLFLFFQYGSARELSMRSSEGVVNHVATTAASHTFQESRELITELDYDDAGPNTNKRSGFTQTLPSPGYPSSRD
ncbi:hypothetical protein Tco_0688987 [Tanacetum coccineum]